MSGLNKSYGECSLCGELGETCYAKWVAVKSSETDNENFEICRSCCVAMQVVIETGICAAVGRALK